MQRYRVTGHMDATFVHMVGKKVVDYISIGMVWYGMVLYECSSVVGWARGIHNT